jgi:tetratricopeptide (TPR) repeat protein
MAVERQNYYRILDLDPDVEDDQAIQTRIKDKQRQWSKQKTSGPPDSRRSAAANLEALRDINRVMSNPESRREEARAAKRLLQQERQEKFKLLDEQIELLSGNGSYTDRDLEQIKRGLNGALNDAEITKRLHAAGLSSAETKSSEQRPRLDPTIAKNIRLNLETIGVADLYQLLDLPPQSSPTALVGRAEERYRELKRVGSTDNRSSARSELLGQCKRLFSDAERKAEYDLFMSEQVFDGLKQHLELAGVDRFLSVEAQDRLIALAVKRGARPDHAEAYIRDYAANRKWGMQRRGNAGSALRLRVCGYCGTLADAAASAERCSSCGEPLDEPCPRCNAPVPTSSSQCGACGCNTGDASLVHALMVEGNEQMASGALLDARKTFDRVLALWPGWEPARAAVRDVQRRNDSMEKDISDIERRIDDGQLGQAQSDFDQAERKYGAARLKPVRSRLAARLQVVAGHLDEGRRLERVGDKNGAIEAYCRALDVQHDCEEARRALDRCPPSPPAGLTVKPLGSGFTLSWSAADGASSYQVIRKAGGHPNAPEDGESSEPVRATRYSDREVPVGTDWYYAVYACRGPAKSSSAACSGPHLRVADVGDLRALPGDGKITLSWTRPTGCRQVEIRRAPDRPPTAVAGEPVLTTTDHFVDSGLVNGLVYGYRVTALFADPERSGDRLRSPGVERTVSPLAPPDPVLDLTARRRGGEFLLRWSPPKRGRVEVRACTERPIKTEGDCIEAGQTRQLGCMVPYRSDGSTEYTPTASVSFLMPLTIAGDLAVVGRIVEVNALDAVSELKSRHLGTSIALTWIWPATVRSVRIVYRYDRFPDGPDDAHATSTVYTLGQYQRQGFWRLQSPEQRPHYFFVYASVGTEGPYATAARCLEPMGTELTVHYVLVRKRKLPLLSFGQQIGLELRSNEDLTLSNLVLVAKPRNLPLSPTDGMTLQEIPSIRLEQGLAWLPIDRRSLEPDTHLKLFFRDHNDARRIRLQHAAASAMRLRR